MNKDENKEEAADEKKDEEQCAVVLSCSNAASTSVSASAWVTLNVGGKLFTTTVGTLCNSEPNSMLALMFSQDERMLPSQKDAEGAYLIDRSGHYFEPILNYLRHGRLIADTNVNLEGVLEEARFYGLFSLVAQLEAELERKQKSPNELPLGRRDVIKALIRTSHISEIRFQGVNLAGADLRKLDFRYINFKYANMRRCNLSYANLSYCCLERTDLQFANLECSQLISVRGMCANMEGADLRNCNLEDPYGTNTNLEGVNLKCACLEGSNMAKVNLRVANLKGANLKNCNLRYAVLAGANLERCNFSHSDLFGANLRGANLKDAELAYMMTPLHMAQTIR